MREQTHDLGRITALTVLLAVSTMAVEASAQETIFDPENPGFEEDSHNEEEDSTEEDPEQSGGEVIFDPERPSSSESTEVVGDDEGAGPRFRDTQWSADYELGTLVDPGFGPTGQDALEIVAGVGMSLRHELSEQTRLVLSAKFLYWAGSGRDYDRWRAQYEHRLDRGYFVHRREHWSLAIGQMRNSWGSTDIIRPGDVIDPVDLRNPLASDGFGAGLGQLSATASYGKDDWSVRAVLVPFFQTNQVAVFGRDTAILHDRTPIVGEQLPILLAAEEFIDPSIEPDVQPFLQASRRPIDAPRSTSGGLRGSWTVSGTDLGLGAYYGWDRTPWVELGDGLRTLFEGQDGQQQGADSTQPDTDDGLPFDSYHKRRATILADFARYVGPIGVRADVAFSPRQVFYTTGFEPVRRSSVFSALGFSYERLLGGVRPLALTVEGFWLHAFGADALIHEALVPEEEGGSADDELLLIDDGYYGVATAVNWATGWWDLEVSGGAVASISPGDFIGRFTMARSWTPRFRTTVGANLFFGPDPKETLSPGGLWAHSDRVVFSISGKF